MKFKIVTMYLLIKFKQKNLVIKSEFEAIVHHAETGSCKKINK